VTGFWIAVSACASLPAALGMATGNRGLASISFAAIAVTYGALTAIQAWNANWFAATYDACAAGVFAWLAWRNRPRNKRLPEKVAGMVRNLGHRLVVVPAPATGGKS
jgi:hypothetical protein